MSNVHQLRPDPLEDDIFFTKTQLVIGTKLRYYGRLEPGSTWEITDIQSYFTTKRVGEYRVKHVEAVRHLSDYVTLENVATGEVRQGSFAYLSYSAIWRLR